MEKDSFVTATSRYRFDITDQAANWAFLTVLDGIISRNNRIDSTNGLERSKSTRIKSPNHLKPQTLTHTELDSFIDNGVVSNYTNWLYFILYCRIIGIWNWQDDDCIKYLMKLSILLRIQVWHLQRW